MAPIAPSKSIEVGGSGHTYATYPMRLEGIPAPLEGIPIDQSGPHQMLENHLKK